MINTFSSHLIESSLSFSNFLYQDRFLLTLPEIIIGQLFSYFNNIFLNRTLGVHKKRGTVPKNPDFDGNGNIFGICICNNCIQVEVAILKNWQSLCRHSNVIISFFSLCCMLYCSMISSDSNIFLGIF